jgi:acyl carrier protein
MTVENRVIELIAKEKNLDPADISLDSTLESLGVDSLDAINLVFELEEQYGISIPDEGALGIETVRQIVEGVEGELAAAEAPSLPEAAQEPA